MCYEVDILIYGQQNIALVLLRQGGQVDVLTGHVDALVRTQHAVVLHLHGKLFPIVPDNLHVQLPVIEEYVVAHLHILADVGVGETDSVVRGVLVGIAYDADGLASLVFYALVGTGGAHFRTLGVDEDAQVRADLAHVPYNISEPVGSGVGRIHADNVDTGPVEGADEFYVAAKVADGCYYFRLFHYLSSMLCFGSSNVDINRANLHISMQMSK